MILLDNNQLILKYFFHFILFVISQNNFLCRLELLLEAISSMICDGGGQLISCESCGSIRYNAINRIREKFKGPFIFSRVNVEHPTTSISSIQDIHEYEGNNNHDAGEN